MDGLRLQPLRCGSGQAPILGTACLCPLSPCLPVYHPLPTAPQLPTAVTVWERPDDFEPERFPLDGPVPNEQNTDYKYIPFRCGLFVAVIPGL